MVGIDNQKVEQKVTIVKKLLIVLIVSMLAMTACSSKEDSTKETGSENTEESNDALKVDKNLLNVEITLPSSMLEGSNVDELIAEAEKDGIKATKNDDGSLTYKMSKSEHKKIMKEMEESFEESIAEMKNGTDFPSIKEITHNKSYSEFMMTVDKEAFENGLDSFAIFGLGLTGMYYQLFNGEDPENYQVHINIKDEATGETFQEVVYPDDLENLETE